MFYKLPLIKYGIPDIHATTARRVSLAVCVFTLICLLPNACLLSTDWPLPTVCLRPIGAFWSTLLLFQHRLSFCTPSECWLTVRVFTHCSTVCPLTDSFPTECSSTHRLTFCPLWSGVVVVNANFGRTPSIKTYMPAKETNIMSIQSYWYDHWYSTLRQLLGGTIAHHVILVTMSFMPPHVVHDRPHYSYPTRLIRPKLLNYA